jgi:hypothetical protein
MGLLSDRLWRRACELFRVAGETGDSGSLPALQDLAWRLRLTAEELKQDLDQLAELGILECNDNHWHVTNFAKRQAPVPDAERQRQSRKRKHKAHYYGDDDVTKHDTPVTDGDTIRKVDPDPDPDPDTETDPDKTEGQKPAPAPPPTAFAGWLKLIQESKNRPAALRFMFETLFRGRDPPSFGYIGKTAKIVGGAGRLAELLWQASTKPPTGDVMRYIQGMAKGQRRNREPVGLDALAMLVHEEAQIGDP